MQRFLPLLALNNIKCKGTMRNKMKFIGIAMILVVVALGYSKNRQPENLDTLLLDNVEGCRRSSRWRRLYRFRFYSLSL